MFVSARFERGDVEATIANPQRVLKPGNCGHEALVVAATLDVEVVNEDGLRVV